MTHHGDMEDQVGVLTRRQRRGFVLTVAAVILAWCIWALALLPSLQRGLQLALEHL